MKVLILNISAKSNITYYLIILITLFSTLGYSQNYKGTIGKYPIFFQVDTDFNYNEATAFYFYQSQLHNIQLTGTYKSNELVVSERFSDVKEKKELFSLQFDNGNLSGTWQHGDKILNVELTETSEDIEAFKLGKLTFIRDSISVFDNKQLVWIKEKYSEKMLFRLGNGFSQTQRELFNLKLDSLQTSYAEIALECSWADINIEINLVSDRYISFSEYSSIYCGGAHPNHNISGYTFDLENNRVVNDITDVYPGLDYYSLLKSKYGNDDDLQEECEYFEDEYDHWQYVSWVFTPKGVDFTPSFPHALTPCEVAFELTYDELTMGK